MRVRLPDRRDPGWWRRRWPAIAMVWSVVVALGVVPIGLGAVPQAVAASSAVTVKGPKLWNPSTGTYGKQGSITLSQSKDLTNQVVQLSWSGFTPTTDGNGQPRTIVKPGDAYSFFAVRIYECRGTDPKVTDCYGSTMYGLDPAAGFQQRKTDVPAPDFPSNMVISPTSMDGSGAATIELYTGLQSPTLACDATHPCSLVVEANYGGDSLGQTNPQQTVDCTNHTLDLTTGYKLASDEVFGKDAANGMSSGEQCAWENRAVVPLAFAPSPAACEAQTSAFRAAGLEAANRAVQLWRSGLCLGDNPLSFQYLPAGGEPQARADFLGGATDVALTVRPDTSTPQRPYVYAPLSASGVSVAFVVDDPSTGRQIRDMKLNARLLAKLLTQSYSPAGGVIASVKGNPTCIFRDQEFLKLNPLPPESGLKWPTSCAVSQSSPIVVGGTTDLVYQLTSWIASDPDAARFLDGEPDPWGMRVDTYYLRPAFSGYPTDSFARQDSSGLVGATTQPRSNWREYEWNPVTTGLGDVARKLLQNKPTCIDPTIQPDGGHNQCAPMDPGSRTLFSIMDAGQAKAYALPEAQLLNPAGGFAAPSTSSFQSAVADMTVDASTGVQQLPYGVADTAYAHDQFAYPLTSVQYAMVPTKGVPDAKAAAITKFLKTVTTSGQVYGTEPGRLAQGFLALTNAQRAQAADAASHVETQDGKLPGNQAAPPNPPPVTPDPGTTGGTGGTPAGGSGATDGAAPGTAPAPVSDGGTAAGGTGDTSADGNTFGTTGGTSGTGGTGSIGSTGSTGTTGGTAGTGGSAAVPAAATAGGAKAAAAPSASGKPITVAPVAAGTPAADRSGMARLLLPIALIGGLVLLVGGPATLLLGGTPAGQKALTGLREGWSRVRRRRWGR
ncbi:hypothetical protein [Kitasatospora sp. NPDC058478]|uniref:hypothetical protein n=1 Tax=unclassified Kitasatospora TaxID=2633591 RepID=UPI003664D908